MIVPMILRQGHPIIDTQIRHMNTLYLMATRLTRPNYRDDAKSVRAINLTCRVGLRAQLSAVVAELAMSSVSPSATTEFVRSFVGGKFRGGHKTHTHQTTQLTKAPCVCFVTQLSPPKLPTKAPYKLNPTVARWTDLDTRGDSDRKCVQRGKAASCFCPWFAFSFIQPFLIALSRSADPRNEKNVAAGRRAQ
jgi:hypothetical protein